MKDRKIKKLKRLRGVPRFEALKALFRKAGLIDDRGRPTEKGRQALETT